MGDVRPLGDVQDMVAPALPYHSELEQPADNEEETVKSLIGSFDKILHTTEKDYGHAVRAVHAKAHALLKGRFEVLASLPPELAQGLFAKPGAYDAYIRISTNPGDLLDDAISVPRGFALKVVGVEGERLPESEGSTQDFVMVNAPAFAAPDPETFAGDLKRLAGTTDKAEGAKIAFSKMAQTVNAALSAVGMPSTTLASMGGAPQVEPLGETYYSATPFRYGDYFGKFRLRPVAPGMTALTGKTMDLHGERDGIREALRVETRAQDLEWAFEVQLARDEVKNPVEHASVVWAEDGAPFAEVARLKAALQDSFAEASVAEIDERMKFSPWTGLEAHRPLGGVNRARWATYRHSADFRSRANGCPLHEPK